VTLVCGASGVGKTRAAKALAVRYNTALGEADDIVTALKAMTTPDQQPLLHYWGTHPEAASFSPEQIAELHLSVADALRPAFEAVIADHMESNAPVVLEGDYLLPELVLTHGVRALVLTDDEQGIIGNYRAREPDEGDQSYRARVSALVTSHLLTRAHRIGVPVIAARPWPTALDRMDAALRNPASLSA
jgi:2-phosphoglycerate kinase